jgi:hypothetical protein
MRDEHRGHGVKEVIERQRVLLVRQTATVGKIAALLSELAGVKDVRVVAVRSSHLELRKSGQDGQI